MAKIKFTISLDAEIADRIRTYAKEHYMTSSAAVTAWALTLPLQGEEASADE